MSCQAFKIDKKIEMSYNLCIALLRKADSSMYEVKRNGKEGFSLKEFP